MTTYKELKDILQENYVIDLHIYTKNDFVRVDSDKIQTDEYNNFIVKNFDLDCMAVTLYDPFINSWDIE